jgi:type I restriction enzyme S subunit
MFIKPDILSFDIVNIYKSNEYISEKAREKARIIPKGSLLVSCIGNIGKLGINIEESSFNQQINAIVHNEKVVSSKYLAYVLKYNQKKLESIANAPVVPIINKSQFSDFEVLIHEELTIQNNIVTILDKAQQLIDKRKDQIEALDELVKSRFIEMFGDPVSNPRGWEKAVCKDVTSKIGSGATPKGGNSSYKEEGISLIRSMNVHNNKFIKKDLAFIDDEQAQKLNNVIVQEEDILLNITGASVARCCIVPNEFVPARVNQHVAIIRSKKERVLPTFLVYQFTNESYQRLLWDIATSGGATREAVTKQQIENLELIVPPLELQNKFADFVKQVDKLKFAMESSLKELENNFNSLMQKAFNGELFN